MRSRNRSFGIIAGATIALSLGAWGGTTQASTPPGDTDPAAGEGTFASGDPGRLIFATLPDHEGAEQDAQPIADWISVITGLEVEMFSATDYTAVVQGLAAGQIDIAQISSFTYIQTQAAGGEIEPIGAQITAEGAEPGYFSVALANPDWDGSTLADFADEAVCFVNPTSTSGRAIPVAQLLEAGVTVSEDNTVYGEEHDLTAAKIAEGTDCMVGFAQDVDADPLIESGELVEVGRFLVPAAPVVMQSALPQTVKDALYEAIADSTQQDAIDAGIELNEFLTENWFGFGTVDDSYFDTIRAVCDQIADQVEACQA